MNRMKKENACKHPWRSLRRSGGYLNKLGVGKKALISSIALIAIILLMAYFLILQCNNVDYNASQVAIKAFSVGDKWENPGGLEVNLPFNLTIQNIGTSDLQGLEVVVEMFESGSSVRVEPFFGEDEQFNGTLGTGEALEIKGLIGTTVNATSTLFPIGGTSETFAYLAKVTLHDNVLDESWAITR